MKELKVKVDGELKGWHKKLAKLGPLVKDVFIEDIYFHTKSLDVLKISRKKEGDFLVQFKHKNGNFIVQPQEQVKDFPKKFDELRSTHGVKRELLRHQIVFKLSDGTIEIDAIEGIGNFLVLVQDNPKLEWFNKNLDLKNPQQITVPFSDL